jgi:hypothetical protein
VGPAYFNFGSVVWVLEGSAYYGYFVANYERSTPRFSQIKRVSLTGGPAVVLTTSSSYIGVGDLATDGTSLFWTDEAGIRKMPIDGGAVQTLVSGPAYSHISLDSGNVYYSSGTGIYKIAKSGGATTTIANNHKRDGALCVASNVRLHIRILGRAKWRGSELQSLRSAGLHLAKSDRRPQRELRRIRRQSRAMDRLHTAGQFNLHGADPEWRGYARNGKCRRGGQPSAMGFDEHVLDRRPRNPEIRLLRPPSYFETAAMASTANPASIAATPSKGRTVSAPVAGQSFRAISATGEESA